MGTGEKLVTKSEEASPLLMYENYIGIWERKQGNVEHNEDEQHEEDKDEDEQHEEGKETAQSVPGEKKTTTKAVRGKYTVHNNGTTKYGGWSEKGMARFNELFELVKEDRKCPQAAAMEKEFLKRAIFDACDSKRRSKAINAEGTAIGEVVNVQRGIVQPAWESDDE
jgi:hypothetical protein